MHKSCIAFAALENLFLKINKNYYVIKIWFLILYSTTNKMQSFLNLFISINCSTCFRRFLRPLSRAQNCTYSVRYCQTNNAVCCYRGWGEISLSVQLEVYMPPTASSISLTIAAGSSIGLTIPDAVCTVSCSRWWAEELPKTCRAIYKNK
jgi:hypothetical protein